MARTFQLDIRTPQGMAFQGEVEAVTLPGSVGPFQVLYNHAPLLTELTVGDIKVVGADSKTRHFATSGGFAEIRYNVVTVLSETVEAAEEIDVERAEAAERRAEELVAQARMEPRGAINRTDAEAALARARNRIKVAERA